jgi:hypothetical protein
MSTLRMLRWTSLGVAGFAFGLHLLGFVADVSWPPLHVGFFVVLFLLLLGAMLALPREDIEIEGTTMRTKDSAWRYVPTWQKVVPMVLGAYALLGLAIQAPGVDEWSVAHMTPALARWTCVLEAVFLCVASATYEGRGGHPGEGVRALIRDRAVPGFSGHPAFY